MMSMKLVTVIPPMALFVMQVFSTTPAFAQTSSEKVARQFQEFCMQESTDHGQRLLDDVEVPTSDVAQTSKLLDSLGADGAWPDLQYDSRARSSWEPGEHLTRLLTLIVYARRDGTPQPQTQECIQAVHRGLRFWMAHDFKCPNWWYNDIGGPKLLGNIALLLNQDLKPDEVTYIADTVLARSKVGSMTGQNRVWLAGNGVMRAALLRNDSLLKKAADVIADEIRVSAHEGIQPDWSFHQHGPQQQFGNYGMAFAVEITKWATVLRDTPYALADEKIAVLRNYLLQGQNWVTWNGVMDISACGRQLFPDSPRKKGGVIRGVMRSMATVDRANSKDYYAFADRNSGTGANDLLGSRFFWRSDYLIYRQPQWAATLKMSSDRIIGGETVNSENLQGSHLADGALFIYRTGNEYENIFPVLNWRLIPGTTEVQDETPLIWSEKPERMKTVFVGGASNGKFAAAAMDFHRGGLIAKKAWFFADNGVFCLGSDICSTAKGPVLTTVNQCLLDGQIVVHENASPTPVPLESANSHLSTAGWIEHSGTRYTSLMNQQMVFSSQPHTGNWHSVFDNPSSPKADVTKSLFTVCIDHGVQPQNAAYAYGISPAGVELKPTIIANSEKVQAIDIRDSYAAAVCWTTGKVELNGIAIEVNQPCILLLNAHQLTVADPTQKLTTITLKVAGQEHVIQLPQAGEAGSSVSIRF